MGVQTLFDDLNEAEFDASAETPSAWSNIESYFRRHDIGMIEDLDDDINTLLVFVSDPAIVPLGIIDCTFL